MLSEHKRALSEDPDNVAIQLSLKTIEKHVVELQDQLRQEKAVREKEVIELRLKGFLAENGTIPLSILANIAKFAADALYATSQRLRKGVDPRRKISKEIINTLDLRLAGISTGSTRLFLTGRTSPDLFGYSLLENTLENTFGLLSADTPDRLTESASDMGIRGAQNINRLLRTLSTSGLEVEISWNSPADKQYVWSGTKEKMLSITNTLESIESLKPEHIEFMGELIMLSMKGQFEIKDKSGLTYKGTFPSQLLQKMKEFRLGEIVQGVIEGKTTVNMATGYEKTHFSLLSIKTQSKADSLPLFPPK
ncbi:MAG: hypothetical protein ACXAB4_01130 [Candidatus Hodarchaeales archaeon]